MDLIDHPLPEAKAPAARFVERRSMRRAACPIDVTVRQRGRFAVAAATADLTPYGARLAGAGPFEPDTEMWLRMPGIESQTVRVVWSEGGTTGVAFAQPLHTAVFARFLPAESRVTLVAAPEVPLTMPAEIAKLPRREQIVRGFGAMQEGPQRHLKKAIGGGLAGVIRRSVVRHVEHRCEERFADTLRTGPMRLTVAETPAQIRNVSASGLKVAATLKADVGTKVAVTFDGFDTMMARVVWRRAEEAGLSLPPDSLEVGDA
ncbi:PilZ domain-containing protein [Novosphingobium sp. Gsoil 351]|uniref:PilZ domain-containing protein n=1 Tax=Novosphingobium sp. Gsoil 351 TaxID=2675225 RepID=UPI0018A803E6|nr:PilZ domain-containing protein [Novosphingobium sp. Gsoil 351]